MQQHDRTGVIARTFVAQMDLDAGHVQEHRRRRRPARPQILHRQLRRPVRRNKHDAEQHRREDGAQNQEERNFHGSLAATGHGRQPRSPD
jgi:hypothetical protein